MLEEPTPDTQEEPTVELELVTEEVATDEPEVETEELDNEEPFELGLPEEKDEEIDTQSEPLRDLKELVKSDPDRALERVTQVEAGLLKLQSQKEEAESYVAPIRDMFEGFANRSVDSINEFEKVLYENTGLTYNDLIELQGGNTQVAQKPVSDPRIETLAKKLEALESEKAATSWITSTGQSVVTRVAKVTGLEFSPEQVWQARQFIPKNATEDQVRQAVMKHDPIAYDKAVAKRDGSKEGTPRAATLPTGKSGAKTTFTHDHEGFLKAYAAKKARSG